MRADTLEEGGREPARTILELELDTFGDGGHEKTPLEVQSFDLPPSAADEIADLPAATERTGAFPPVDVETTVVDADLPASVHAQKGPHDSLAAKRAEARGKEELKPETAGLEEIPEEEEEQAQKEDEEAPAPEAESSEARKAPEQEEATAKTYLAHFENVLAKLPGDERAKIATTGSGNDLYALCFDKDPQVIRALWQNVNIANEHARFAAFHHRTTLGLELIAQRAEFFKDPQIQRRLIRNPMVSETLLRKMLLPKRLLDIYKVTLDREAAERTRQSARGFLRNKFAVTEPEDRVELIWKTEGRALTALSGLSIDSKTAAIICGRPLVSVMLVQSFCRFAATPPSVIGHFLKQNLVRRQVHLRNALLKHPNCPSDAKRAF
jgi:hypothetical protein